MTGEQRQRLRHLIDQRKRRERARILAMAKGRGRCSGCGERHEDYNLACQQCRDRKRLRDMKDLTRTHAEKEGAV